MNYTLRPYTNEMWEALEEKEEQFSSSSCSTCLSPSRHEFEAEAENDNGIERKAQTPLSTQQPQAVSSRSPERAGSEPPTPTTPKLYPDIDSQHLDPLQTLATVATCSPGSLSRLTGQGQSRVSIRDNAGKPVPRVREDEEEEEEEEEEHGTHHTRSPRSYAIYRAQQDAKRQLESKSQREVMSRTTHQKRQREVESPPARNLRRRPSPPAASSSHRSLSRNSPLPSHSQSRSQPISSPSTSKLPDHQDDIVVRYPQTRGSRRPVLDISSERLLSSLRDQLRESQFPRYTMPHPKRDGSLSGKKWRCAYEFETGSRCNIACSRKGEARRHAFTHEIHLRWICPSLAVNASSCGKLFARQDAAMRHVEQSKTCKDLAANRSEGFPILVWEEEDEIVAKIVTLEWTEDDDNEGNE